MTTSLLGMIPGYVFVLPLVALAVIVLLLSLLVFFILRWACRGPRNHQTNRLDTGSAGERGWANQGRAERSSW
jgi:hypothetical protein